MVRSMLMLSILFMNATCYARPNRNYYSSQPSYATTNNSSYTSHTIGMSDQDRCQAEANYMAANRISGHVWGCIGSFEGVGVGYSPNCNTCTPSNNMRLTGDASAQDSSGRWYRVRSWR